MQTPETGRGYKNWRRSKQAGRQATAETDIAYSVIVAALIFALMLLPRRGRIVTARLERRC